MRAAVMVVNRLPRVAGMDAGGGEVSRETLLAELTDKGRAEVGATA